jgi:hypothetical protein
MATTTLGATAATMDAPVLGRRLQHVLAILFVLFAIKAPLGIPLYFNGGFLVVGLATLLVLQRVQRLWIWMLVLIGLGILSAAAAGSLGTSVPRLVQLFLIVLAISLISRIDPDLLARYLLLLLPAMVLVAIAESLLPEPLYGFRPILGMAVYRHAGLQGEPNYNAMLYGVVGVILAQHRPRVLAVLPFLLSIPSLSRAFLLGLVAWLGALSRPRLVRRLVPALILLICAQPLIVLGVDQVIEPATRDTLSIWSSHRYPIWVAHARMGIAEPIGVGYFRGEEIMKSYDDYFAPDYPPRPAHSLFLQVFGEFGWVGYPFFVGFLLTVGGLVRRWAPGELPTLLFILTGYAFVNGLSDWPFWFGMGYLLARARVGAEAASDERRRHADP